MTQKEKDLLLKDLCARLPYGVKVEYENKIFDIDYISSYQEIKLDDYIFNYTIDVSDVKPYLFPLESMTEEQQLFYSTHLNYMPYYQRVDWFNKHHLDYRGIIPLGIAIDATGLDIYKS